MKNYILIILLCITAIPKIVNATTYIDDPGNTVVVSSPISDQVYVDYYTPTQPGTHVRIVPGGSTQNTRIYNYGMLTMAGGLIVSEVWFYDNSSGDILSGNVNGYIRVTENSSLTMSGGSNLSGWMGVFDNGQAAISGGHFGDLELTAHALVSLTGSNFRIGGQTVTGLLDIDQLVEDGLLTPFEFPEYSNIQYEGVLSGVLSDNTSFSSNISITHFTDGRGDTANINLIPEPATVVLMGTGACVLIRRRK